jgi:hypothetical protein
MRTTGAADWSNNFRRRILQDSMQEATASYWIHRAHQLERGLPQPGDYPGTATPAQEAARVAALRSAIDACYNHSRLWRGDL